MSETRLTDKQIWAGLTDEQLEAAADEYEVFAADHPAEDLADVLADCARRIRVEIHRRATEPTERFESELRIWAEKRSRRGWGPAFVPPYTWTDK